MLYVIAHYLYEYEYETHVGSASFFGPFESKEQGEAFTKILTEDISTWSRGDLTEDIDTWEFLGWARDIEPQSLISSPFQPLKTDMLEHTLRLYEKKTNWKDDEHKSFHIERIKRRLATAETIAQKLEALGLKRPHEETV